MIGDHDWPVNASCGFVIISWASCSHRGKGPTGRKKKFPTPSKHIPFHFQ